ncbi:MAG: hypothetical protein FWH37_09820, partial [Candidatus Bathyarchaeota archaeon]|nr:hypothetical protein [Candidatus Termiticorpusculum sp.]
MLHTTTQLTSTYKEIPNKRKNQRKKQHTQKTTPHKKQHPIKNNKQTLRYSAVPSLRSAPTGAALEDRR